MALQGRKKLFVKADLAMYSYTVDASEQSLSVSLILGCKLDFSSCAIRAGFHKSSHIYVCVCVFVRVRVCVCMCMTIDQV